MNNQFKTGTQVLVLLEGTWQGEGRGGFPGVTSFGYRETLVFTHRDERILAYQQRTQKLYDGQTEYLQSHWESGFIRLLESGDLEMTSAQIGRTEVLTGKIEIQDTLTRIHFQSKTITNDPRMISSARTFELAADTLRYQMEMHTTKVSESTHHLTIALQRIK